MASGEDMNAEREKEKGKSHWNNRKTVWKRTFKL